MKNLYKKLQSYQTTETKQKPIKTTFNNNNNNNKKITKQTTMKTNLATIASDNWAEGLTIRQAVFLEQMYSPESENNGKIAKAAEVAGYSTKKAAKAAPYTILKDLQERGAVDRFRAFIADRRLLTRPILQDLAFTQYVKADRAGDRSGANKAIEILARLTGNWQEHIVIDSAKQYIIEESIRTEARRISSLVLTEAIDAEATPIESTPAAEPAPEPVAAAAEPVPVERPDGWFLDD